MQQKPKSLIGLQKKKHYAVPLHDRASGNRIAHRTNSGSIIKYDSESLRTDNINPYKIFRINIMHRIIVVPGGGLEPPWDCSLRILSPLRLPISPSGQTYIYILTLIGGQWLVVSAIFLVLEA